MQVTVHHQRRDATGFTAVASITTESASDIDALDHAYRWTQNICGSWSFGPTIDNGRGFMVDNPDHTFAVTVLAAPRIVDGKPRGHRSSMVGDVFCIDGKRWYEVAAAGFEPCQPVAETA